MKYVFRLCARADENESIDVKHSKLVEGLMRLDGSWGLPTGDYLAPEVGEELSAQFQLGDLLGKGIKGFVNYRFRGGLRDESDYDDYVDLEFNPERIDYSGLLNEAFPAYIECFEPYRAFVGNEEFTYIDFDRSRGFNHRTNVLRIHPANYFDGQLCERAFEMSANAVLDRLVGLVARAELVCGGVFFIVKETPMSIEDAERVNETLLSRLGVDAQV